MQKKRFSRYYPLLMILLVIFTLEIISWIISKTNLTKLEGGFEEDVFSYYVPHPYFGFIPSIETGERFFDEENFKKLYLNGVKEQSSLSIGIFGGSVAQNLADNIENTGLIPTLKEELKCLENQKINIVNLAFYSSKQPQTFAVLSHYHPLVDIAISVEGINEMENDPYPYFPIDYPLFSKILFPRKSYLIGKSNTLFIFNKISFFLSSLDTISPTINLFSKLVSRKLVDYCNKEGHTLAKDQETKVFPPYSKNLNYKERTALLINVWSHFATTQLKMMNALSKPSFIFIQPIPKNRRPELLERYQQLTDHANELNSQGFRIFTLSNIFDNAPKKVFKDSCCHINDHGRRKLAKKIVATLKKHKTAVCSKISKLPPK